MKKTAILLFLFGAGLAASAQNRYPGSPEDRYQYPPTQQDADRYHRDRGDRSKTNSNWNNERQRLDMEVRRINQDFDYRVAQVQNDRRLRNRDRKRQLKTLEQERQEQLRAAQNRFVAYQRNDGRNNGNYRH